MPNGNHGIFEWNCARFKDSWAGALLCHNHQHQQSCLVVLVYLGFRSATESQSEWRTGMHRWTQKLMNKTVQVKEQWHYNYNVQSSTWISSPWPGPVLKCQVEEFTQNSTMHDTNCEVSMFGSQRSFPPCTALGTETGTGAWFQWRISSCKNDNLWVSPASPAKVGFS